MYAEAQMSVRMFMTIRTSGSAMTGRSTSEPMLRGPSSPWMEAISRSSAACFSSAEWGKETPKRLKPSRALVRASA